MPKHFPPESLIRFMGKSGFVTRELWEDFFHTNQKKEWNRKAWAELVHRKYCRPHPESRIVNVLVLNPRNAVIQNILGKPPVPSQRGALLAHDEILYRGILLAQTEGSMAEWKSEAELKANGRDSFRIESSNGRTKYPDALILVPDAFGLGSRVLAIECELTQKAARRYEKLLDAYAGFADLAGLIFITDSPSVKGAIIRQIQKGGAKGLCQIRFVTTKDWKEYAPEVLRASSRYRPEAGLPGPT